MGASKYLAPAASTLRVDPSGAWLFLIHTSLFLSRRLRSSILPPSRLVWIKNTHACHPFEVLRGTLARTIDLGTFYWKPTRYRWKPDGLRIETALPRDTVIGAMEDPVQLYISPINPTPEDTVRITVEWTTSGQPMVADQLGIYMKDCCTLLIDIRFGMRTDTDIYGESYPRRAIPWVFPQLKAGRYRLHQVPLTGEAVLDIDLLLGKELFFTVRDYLEP
jgi:hypothetical protein